MTDKKEVDKNYVRIALDFHVDAVTRLDTMAKNQKVSRAEIIRSALKLYEYACFKIENNFEPAFIKRSETLIEISIPNKDNQ